MKGNLYLIPTTLGDTMLNNVLPESSLSILNEITHYIVENVRTARRFLVKAKINHEIDDLTFYELNKHSNPKDYHSYLSASLKGEHIGILSEAGCPGIADPGRSGWIASPKARLTTARIRTGHCQSQGRPQ